MRDRFCRARAEFASRSDGVQVGTPVVDLEERPLVSACGYELRLVRLRPILLKNSKMHSLHFLAKLNRDRQFAL